MSCLHLHGSHKGQVGEGRPLNSLGERIIEHRQGQDPTSPSVIVLSHDLLLNIQLALGCTDQNKKQAREKFTT
jgi:hypothetical protein